MRLRWILALAFLALAALQVAVVVPPAQRNLSALLEAQQRSRERQLMVAATAEHDRLVAHVLHALDELAQSRALEDVARDATHIPPPPELTGAAAALMAPRGLDVLALLDDQGRTLSSGHLPARLGEPDDPLFAVTRAPPGSVSAGRIEVSGPEGLVEVQALVASRALDYGERRAWAVGGVRLDQHVVESLARLTGAQVSLGTRDTVWPSGTHVLVFGDAATAGFTFPTDDLEATRREVLRSFLVLALVGLALSVVAGFVVSRYVTRPVEALTDAARRIASGAPGATVAERGSSSELTQLVATFNRMTADLKTATDQLVASERVAAWQEVARRLAHEIKNPLTPIRLSLETLLAASQRTQLEPRFQALFKESAVAVLEEVDRLKRIVDEFSQFARLPRPVLAPLDLSEAVGQVMALYGPHDGLSYQVQAGAGIQVKGDRDQLTQVLVNLIKNAEEAMAGTGGGTVHVHLTATTTQAVLEVRDEGPGIAPQLAARLFEPYVTTKAQGTGLGLAIALRIAQEHEGTLELAPPGAARGATFRLTLPLAHPA